MRLQSGLVVTLDLFCRTIIGELCEISAPSATRSFFLRPSPTFQLPVSVYRSHFSRQNNSKRFFSSLGGVLGAAKLALAWQTKELPSASPVAFLTTGNFQLLLWSVFSASSLSGSERDAFLVRRRRLWWGKMKLWPVCSQAESWLVNGAGPM